MGRRGGDDSGCLVLGRQRGPRRALTILHHQAGGCARETGGRELGSDNLRLSDVEVRDEGGEKARGDSQSGVGTWVGQCSYTTCNFVTVGFQLEHTGQGKIYLLSTSNSPSTQPSEEKSCGIFWFSGTQTPCIWGSSIPPCGQHHPLL